VRDFVRIFARHTVEREARETFRGGLIQTLHSCPWML
jgi:hypothetical protein